jgi:hypothetical protein
VGTLSRAWIAICTIACAPSAPGEFRSEEGFSVVYADPSVEDLANGAEPDGVPERCFGVANTLLVGPGPGCATLLLVEHRADPLVCEGATRLLGAPLRIVRRGDLPARVEIEVAASSLFLGAVDETPRAPLGLYRVADASHPECCDPGGDATRGDPSPSLTDVVLDESVELIAVLGDGEAVVRACAVERTEARTAFTDACRASCAPRVACGWAETVAQCVRGCEVTAARDGEGCLGLRRALLECEAPWLSECPRLDMEPASPCLDLRSRLVFECGG